MGRDKNRVILSIVGEVFNLAYKKQGAKMQYVGIGENAQYDNVIVVTPNFDPAPVEPNGKLAVTWGTLKTQ